MTGSLGQRRRHVVVLFIDMVGSTQLAEQFDPELITTVLGRYHRACTDAVHDHGGVVEKYIGDAVMAVFGVEASHEDDATRAVRAAAAAREAVLRLSADLDRTHDITLDVHSGVAAGEVFIVSATGSDLRVVGDAVNTASRLQSVAADGEIVVSDDAAQMVGRAAEFEALPELHLKGKQAPVRAWRVTSLRSQDDTTTDDLTPLVNRNAEIDQLARTYERAIDARHSYLVTVLGAPGIGKSRLARSFVDSLGGRPVILSGRCPPYGSGATYRPLAQLLESLNGGWTSIEADLHPRAAATLRSIADTGHDGVLPGVEEISFAVRHLFEQIASTQSLVIVIDDVQWGEPTFLDLVEDVAGWLIDVPVLILCLARADLLDTRPTWSGGLPQAMTLELGPLTDQHLHELLTQEHTRLLEVSGLEVTAHADDALRLKAAEYADGNPLLGELMLHRLVDDGIDAPIPPTVRALVGARLDRLTHEERDFVERAATVGHTFSLTEVSALYGTAHDGADVDTLTRRLCRHRLARRLLGHHNSFEFTQTLTREIAYALANKSSRADWHITLADIVASPPTTPEEPFVGRTRSDRTRHLEAAYRLTREVRPDDPGLSDLAVDAGSALLQDGSQALHQKDLPAARSLLQRAREILPAGHRAHRVVTVRLCDAAFASGDPSLAASAIQNATPDPSQDRGATLTLRILRDTMTLRYSGVVPSLAGIEAEMADGGDDLAWCRFHQLQTLVRVDQGRFAEAEAALEQAARRARTLGDRYEEDRATGGLCELAQWSPTPVADGIARCSVAVDRFAEDRALVVPVLLARSRLHAMAADLTRATADLDTAAEHVADLHLDAGSVALAQARATVASMAGDPAEAHRQFTRATSELTAAGLTTIAYTLRLHAILELIRAGRAEAAAADLARTCRPSRPQHRADLLHATITLILAAQSGDHSAATHQADALAEAVEATDDLCLRGEILAEVAAVDRALGRTERADEHLATASESYLRKGATLPVHRLRTDHGEEA